MNRGEIWIAIWPNDPEKKQRPVLIVSNNFRNQASRLQDIIIVKITSLQNSVGKNKPTNPSEDVLVTLRKPSIIRCASIYTIEKSALKTKLIQLHPKDMAKVDACIKTVLDIN